MHSQFSTLDPERRIPNARKQLRQRLTIGLSVGVAVFIAWYILS